MVCVRVCVLQETSLSAPSVGEAAGGAVHILGIHEQVRAPPADARAVVQAGRGGDAFDGPAVGPDDDQVMTDAARGTD